jgi:hypothetical protein
MMLGYWNRPETNAELFLADGWFRTGDIVRKTADGYHYYVGRIRDVIRRSGENISAAEVEQQIGAMPKVQEVAAIPVPDRDRDEEVKVIIVPAEGASITPHEVVEWANRRLARFKTPRYIEFRDNLPHLGSGKVAKAELKAEEPFGGKVIDTMADNFTNREQRVMTDSADLLPTDSTSDSGTTPAVVGEVIIGEPFVVSREDVDHFERGTWLDRAYPPGAVPEFPETLVEGFHLLALVDPVLRFALGDRAGQMWGLNYGLDNVRFVSQVHLGDRVHSHFEILDVQPKDVGFKVLRRCTFTVEGADRPAMVADWWGYQLPRGQLEKSRRA